MNAEVVAACQRVIDTVDARLADESYDDGNPSRWLSVEGRVTYLHLKGDHHARIAQVLQDDPRADKAADDGVPAYQFGEARLAYAAAQQEALSGLADPRHPLRIQCALKMCEIATAGALGAEFALEAWEAATRVYEVVCHALNEAEDEDDESRSGVLTSSKTAENPTIHLVQLLRDQLGLIEAQWSLDQANLIEDDNDDDDDSSEGTGVDSKKSRRSMTSKQRSPGAASILSDGNAATMTTLKLRDSVRGIKRVITSAQTRDKNPGTVTLFSRAESAARLRRAGNGNAGAEGRLARVGRALKIIFESYVKGNTKSGTQVDGGSVLVDGHGRLGIDEFFGRGPCVASRQNEPFDPSPRRPPPSSRIARAGT